MVFNRVGLPKKETRVQIILKSIFFVKVVDFFFFFLEPLYSMGREGLASSCLLNLLKPENN